jgi:hypothetical protein
MIRYTVKGSGAFPFDQLRYDQSYPADTEAAIAIEGRGFRKVNLSGKRYTAGRWASFGWVVLVCEHLVPVTANGLPRKCCA